MSENVVGFNAITRLDLPAERTINGALEAGLQAVVVIGWGAEGDFYFASNKADGGDALWLLEIAKKRLLEMGDEE